MGELLSIMELSHSYHNLSGEMKALAGISFQVDEGEFISVVGPAGCGKSTLLSLIAGLLKPSDGTIEIDGKKQEDSGVNIGYMLQKDHLLEWKSTLKNLTLGLELQDKLKDNSYMLINQMLETYGLIAIKDTKPSELSGGMRQRVALIRTLLLEPDILLLDEPFSALDYKTKWEVSDDIWGIIRKEKKTAILITHDIAEALSMADRIVILSERPATIKKIIDVKLTIEGEKKPSVARKAPEFQSYLKLIEAELSGAAKKTKGEE